MKTSIYKFFIIGLILIHTGCCENNIIEEQIVNYPTLSTIELSRSEEFCNDAFNNFGIQLFNEAAKSKEDNFVFSPLSMALCVSMVANACDQTTVESIVNILGCDDIKSVNSLSHKLMQFLPDKTHGAVLSLANSIWYSSDLLPSDDYRNRVSNYFYSDISPINFSSEEEIEKIKNWCNNNSFNISGNKIVQPSPETLLLCLNALYYRGEWTKPFDLHSTDIQIFYGSNCNEKIEMMHNTIDLPYSDANLWESICIPYKGDYRMVVFLPKEGHRIQEVASSINYTDVYNALNTKEFVTTKLSMPKFNYFSNVSLTNELKSLGVNCKPTSMAGFDGNISLIYDHFVEFQQATSIEVNEKGSVVSSVSVGNVGGNISDYPSKSITLNLNRPFIFMIINQTIGSVIIAGIFQQPTLDIN